jgi:glutathione synthase/RimK-type ligase-like ATP-grasp enzyme
MQRAVTIVTHQALPNGAPDDRLLARALEHEDIAVRFAVWNDHDVRWETTPLAIVRSTWDYYRNPAQWSAWLACADRATTLANPAVVLHWNSDKRYLIDLARRGVPCVPTDVVTLMKDEGTARVEMHARPILASLAQRRGWRDVVVKPAIAASAFGARRFTDLELSNDGEVHLRALLVHGAVLVQPYVSALEHEPERSLVYIGGRFTHAFTKPAFSTDATGTTEARLHSPAIEEQALADAALAAARATLTDCSPPFNGNFLYARVDIVPTPDGPLLMELELIEPDLALRLSADSTECLAKAAARMLSSEHPICEADPV